MNHVKILFLAANPVGTGRLALDEEVHEIEAKIRAAEHRDDVELISKWAVRTDDLLQYFNQHQAHIVHFSGHGSPSDEIILVGPDGTPQPVSKAALASLFRVLKDNIRVVVLNACFSRPQAEAIVEHIDCAIGMNKAIGDRAARTFAASFYRAIGFGRSVQAAFEQGLVALQLEGIPADQTPELLVHDGADPSQIVLIGSIGGKIDDPSPRSPQASQRPPARATSRAVEIWRDKLAYLGEQEAITAEANQKFALRHQMEEAKRKIEELGG